MCTLCARSHFATFSRLDARSMDVKFLVVMTMVSSVLMSGTEASRPAPMKDDDDTKEDMMADFYEKLESFEFTMTNATSGEPIAGAGAIVVPTFSGSMVDVGVFLPESYMGTRSSDENGSFVDVSVCEFSNPAACANEEPYPGAPADYVCGLSDESREETGFDCDTIKVRVEPDGDLSFEAEIAEDDDDDVDYEDAAPAPSPETAPAPAPEPMRRKLLASPRFGRANPTRSRTLRTAGARGFGRGRARG